MTRIISARLVITDLIFIQFHPFVADQKKSGKNRGPRRNLWPLDDDDSDDDDVAVDDKDDDDDDD